MRANVIALIAVVAAAVPAALAFDQPTLATDYCVAPNTSCGGVNLQDLQTALNDASVDAAPDRIFLGAATYTAPNVNGFIYDPLNGGPVEITGQGRAQTVIAGVSGSFRTLA